MPTITGRRFGNKVEIMVVRIPVFPRPGNSFRKKGLKQVWCTDEFSHAPVKNPGYGETDLIGEQQKCERNRSHGYRLSAMSNTLHYIVKKYI